MIQKIIYVNPTTLHQSTTLPSLPDESTHTPPTSPLTTRSSKKNNIPKPFPHNTFIYIPPSLLHIESNEHPSYLKGTYAPHIYAASTYYKILPKERIIITFNDKNTYITGLNNTTLTHLKTNKIRLALFIKNLSTHITILVEKHSSLIDLLNKNIIQSSLTWVPEQQLKDNKENSCSGNHYCADNFHNQQNTDETQNQQSTLRI
jgi:hypothetical protein